MQASTVTDSMNTIFIRYEPFPLRTFAVTSFMRYESYHIQALAYEPLLTSFFLYELQHTKLCKRTLCLTSLLNKALSDTNILRYEPWPLRTLSRTSFIQNNAMHRNISPHIFSTRALCLTTLVRLPTFQHCADSPA